MPSIAFILLILLLQRSWVIAIPDDSMINSVDIFDPSAKNFAVASFDPNLYLEDPTSFTQPNENPDSLFTSMGSDADSDLFGDLDDTFSESNGLGDTSSGSNSLGDTSSESNGLAVSADSDLISADDSCAVPNGQSRKRMRKRDGGVCDAPGVPSRSENTEAGDQVTENRNLPLAYPEFDFFVCGKSWPFFGRRFDVCCTGLFGPFLLDPGARLVYRWISDCRLGRSTSCFDSLRLMTLTTNGRWSDHVSTPN